MARLITDDLSKIAKVEAIPDKSNVIENTELIAKSFLLRLASELERIADIPSIENQLKQLLTINQQYAEKKGTLTASEISALAEKLKGIDKTAISTFEDIGRRYIDLVNLGEKASVSLEDAKQFAYFLLLIDAVQSPQLVQWAIEWARKAASKYPSSGFLKYFYGYAIDGGLGLGITPESDPVRLLIEGLHEEPHITLRAQEKYIEILEDISNKYSSLEKQRFENVGKKVFPEITLEQYRNMLFSFLYAKLADYHGTVGSSKVKDYAEKALLLWADNSLALSILGFLKIDQDTLEAEGYLKKSLALVDAQLGAMPQKDRIKGMSLLGLAMIYSKRGALDIAEQFTSQAIQFNSSGFLQAFILLVRGTIRSEEGKYSEAIADLLQAQGEARIRPVACVNLAKIHYNQGMYEKAKSQN